jgi:hypothetical protein
VVPELALFGLEATVSLITLSSYLLHLPFTAPSRWTQQGLLREGTT